MDNAAVHNGATDGAERVVSVDEVEQVRQLLRRRDLAARQLGLTMLEEWLWHADLDERSARALVQLAAIAHPVLQGSLACPAERIQEMLALHSDVVDPHDVLSVFSASSEVVRRGWLHLLASQCSDASLDVLIELIGPDASGERVPRPRSGLLRPLAEHPRRDSVLDLACSLLERPGWVRPAAELLLDLAVLAPLPPQQMNAVGESITAAAGGLIDACSRASVADPRSGDLARTERDALTQLVAVVDLIDDVTAPAPRLWWMMLASADPRVGALGAVRLVRAGERVAPERLRLLARDPIARVELHDGFAGMHPTLVPEGLLGHGPLTDARAVAEGRLVRWLVDVLELGRVPDEIEHVAEIVDAGVVDADGVGGPVHLFRFRVHSPHWSAARGWMIGVASQDLVGSCYRAEDECDLTSHVLAIAQALEEWPDRREDGAA